MQTMWKSIALRSNVGAIRSMALINKPNPDNPEDTYKWEDIKPFESIPGPKPLPIIGNLWRYFPFIGEYKLNRLFETYNRMFKQYGSLVREEVFKNRILLHVFDKKNIAHVYECDGMMPLRRSHRAILKYRRDRPDIYKCAGLFPTNGEEWKTFRKKFNAVVLDMDNVESAAASIEDVADELVNKIPLICDEKGEVDIQPELFKWALESIGAIALERRFGCLDLKGNKEAERLVKAAATVHDAIFRTENAVPLWMYVPTPTYMKIVRNEQFFEKVVRRHMNDAMDIIKRDNLKSTLLARLMAVDTPDYKDVFTMVLDMFIAGIDSTSVTTGFALYNLARYQDVQDKLRAAVMEQLPEKSSKLAGHTEIPYMLHFLRETMRVNPIAIGIGRVLNQDTIMDNYLIPAGTLVILQHQVASLQPENFENPLEFNPERWDRSIPGRREIIRATAFSSLPFGTGIRSCIGRRFAEKEMQVLLAKLVRNYKIEYYYEDIGAYTRLINVPDKPVKLRFTPITK